MNNNAGSKTITGLNPTAEQQTSIATNATLILS